MKRLTFLLGASIAALFVSLQAPAATLPGESVTPRTPRPVFRYKLDSTSPVWISCLKYTGDCEIKRKDKLIDEVDGPMIAGPASEFSVSLDTMNQPFGW